MLESMPRVIIDFEPSAPDAPGFDSDSSQLVYFLSWAFSARYGGNHELALASLVLRGEFKIDIKPLLTFADREIEEPEDAEPLERAWQEAAPLAEACERIVEAFDGGNQKLDELQEHYPRLRDNIETLGRLATWARGRDAQIRITYLMADKD